MVGKRTALARKAGKEVSVGAGVRGVEGAERSIYEVFNAKQNVERYTASALNGSPAFLRNTFRRLSSISQRGCHDWVLLRRYQRCVLRVSSEHILHKHASSNCSTREQSAIRKPPQTAGYRTQPHIPDHNA